MKTATYKDRLLHLGIFALSVLLLGSCIDNGQTGVGATIRFNVCTEDNDAPKTRSASGIIACTTDFATGSTTDTVFLIEHEEAFSDHTGIPTRANITTTISQKFSSIGYRGATSGAGISTTPWFYNAETNPNGTLVIPVYWGWAYRYARFYAIYPRVTASYPKISLSPENHPSTPYVDFEVESKVTDQKDLLTACSGEVHYATQGVQPRTDLKFRHALTAVRFKVGPNLSWNKKITKVEIINAKSKGRYTLPTDTTGIGAQWSNRSDPATFTLGGDGTVNVPLNKGVGSVIMGNPGDNYTFYMIPQPLSGVSVKIYFDNNPTPAITANLAGSWKPGTVKTYSLSQITSDWQYKLTVTSPAAVNCNATSTGNYTIRSYREDPTGTEKQSVAWRVVGYQESADGGLTFGSETTVKPTWLIALTLVEGTGSTSTTGETGNATIQAATLGDRLALYNQELQRATQKGSPTNYYDLSTHDVNGNTTPRNTANSYLISASGWYKIPLVYGNAIKNDNDNPSAYKTANTGSSILRHFKDHAGQNINSPYINVQNASYPATQAGIVWTDQSGIVEASSLSVTNNGADSYVNFHVPDDKIKNGNAVIAVKNASGTIMWSWHLWFDHSDVLQTVACTNYQGYTYNFTKQTLGFAYRKWEGTPYDKPRVARLKVEQTVANGGVKQVDYIDITQNPGSGVKEISSTHYQFGRKDAMPGIDAIADGSFTPNGGNNMSIQNGIQHPGTFYTQGTSWSNGYYANGYNKHNLWSMDNTTISLNDDPVVKTIYDPCPAGFHMPAANAFSGFNTNGGGPGGLPNVSGDWDYGYHFNNKINAPDATVYFPALGCRSTTNGFGGFSLFAVGRNGYYWTAVPHYVNYGCYLLFLYNPQASPPASVIPFDNHEYRSSGLSVRPVSE